MTNELKEKILECLEIGYYVGGDKKIYGLPQDQIKELLAIIDEGIEEAFDIGRTVGMNAVRKTREQKQEEDGRDWIESSIGSQY